MPTSKTSEGTPGSSPCSSFSSPVEEKFLLLKDSSSPDSSSSSSGAVEDASIYFRVDNRNGEYDWYVIKGGKSKTPERKLLSPVLPKPPIKQWWSGCGVVGSTIYALGGADIDYVRLRRRRDGIIVCPPLHRDVYYIDARRPGDGWKKSRHSMNKGRANPYVVSNLDFEGKGKIMYVFGTDHQSHDVPRTGEVFEDDGRKGWRVLGPMPPDLADGGISGGHAVDGKSIILFHSYNDPYLHAYHTESDSWEIFSDSSIGFDHYTSAVVDGILYTLNFAHPGILYAIDVSNPENCSPKQVLGLDKYSIPTETAEDKAPLGFLVSLGNSKLAVVWASLYGAVDRDMIHVYCSKLRMCKRCNDDIGKVEFRADRLSFSVYCVMGTKLRNCLAIFPSKKSVTKEDVSKDGNTTVTNNSCDNSSSNNNDSGEKKKKNKNKDKKQI